MGEVVSETVLLNYRNRLERSSITIENRGDIEAAERRHYEYYLERQLSVELMGAMRSVLFIETYADILYTEIKKCVEYGFKWRQSIYEKYYNKAIGLEVERYDKLRDSVAD